jgi:hypothetical protein
MQTSDRVDCEMLNALRPERIAAHASPLMLCIQVLPMAMLLLQVCPQVLNYERQKDNQGNARRH